MSLAVPSWRSAPRRLFYSRASLPIRMRDQPRRALSYTSSRKAGKDASGDAPPIPSNPVLEEYKRNNPELPPNPLDQQQQKTAPGDISTSSIFEDERRAQMQDGEKQKEDRSEDRPEGTLVGGHYRDMRNMLRVLDPDPNARERWERKKVIQTIRRGGRLNKALFIKRTEREHLAKSHNLKTSVKKLTKLARQIAGKPIDDAITQMRFSRKKVATEVLKQLEFARDEAVVMRGMGLGKVKVEEDAETLNETTADVSGTATDSAEAKKGNEPIHIQLKSGKRHIVSDLSRIYIDQAWVGRGPYGKLPDYRAKGRMNIMRTPFTSISLLLKEEATRVREWEEREARQKKRREEKVWVPLPDRPVQVKSQWYSW